MNDTSKKIVNRLKNAKDIENVFKNLYKDNYKIVSRYSIDSKGWNTTIDKGNTHIEIKWCSLEMDTYSNYKQAILGIKY